MTKFYDGICWEELCPVLGVTEVVHVQDATVDALNKLSMDAGLTNENEKVQEVRAFLKALVPRKEKWHHNGGVFRAVLDIEDPGVMLQMFALVLPQAWV